MFERYPHGIPRLYAAASLKRGPPRLHRGPGRAGIPRLYAAASLKLGGRCRRRRIQRACIPRLYAAASLKRRAGEPHVGVPVGIPRLYAAASLKHDVDLLSSHAAGRCIPRLYAAASLKPGGRCRRRRIQRAYSAALCRGLIEASSGRSRSRMSWAVFRGFMPRPH